MLKEKQDLASDLASQMFGHLVPTEVAQHILATFVTDGVLQVFEGEISGSEEPSGAPLGPSSEDVQRILGQAFDATKAHDCFRLRPGENAPEKHVQSATQEEQEEKKHSFKWRILPPGPLGKEDLVSFLNDITDRAFTAAKTHLPESKLELRHRLVAPRDDHPFIRLTYHPVTGHVQDPDFLLLPIQAFSGEGFKTVDERYINFSAARLMGVWTDDLAENLEDTQSYAEGLKHAQPWVFYVVGMTISLAHDMVFFSRLDPSGWEHLALMLWDGRGCVEFIRILLGLALADGIDLGQNPFFSLMLQERTFKVERSADVASDVDSCASSDDSDSVSTASDSSSYASAPGSPRQNPVEKRRHSEIEMKSDGEEDPQAKKNKVSEAM